MMELKLLTLLVLMELRNIIGSGYILATSIFFGKKGCEKYNKWQNIHLERQIVQLQAN